MEKSNKTLIFDFDGTITSNFDSVIKVFDTLSLEFGYKRVTKEDIANYREKGLRGFISGLKISFYKLPFLIKKTKKELGKHVGDFKMVPGMKDALKGLKRKGYSLGIITSNSEENAKSFLKNNNLEIFDFVSSGPVFGKEKILKRAIKKRKLARDDVFYVGDEIRDIEVARKAKVKIISVGWGYCFQKSLKKFTPDYLINKPQDLLKVVK